MLTGDGKGKGACRRDYWEQADVNEGFAQSGVGKTKEVVSTEKDIVEEVVEKAQRNIDKK